MKKTALLKIPLPGLRNIKTAIAIAICMFFYALIGRDSAGALMAAMAALICMQDSVEKSYEQGLFRVIGTSIGAVFGIGITYFDLMHKPFYVGVLACFFGIILLIYICNLLKIQGSIIMACIIFLIITTNTNTDMSPFLYSFNRVLDTIIGIIIAITVNVLLFKPKPERKKQSGNFVYGSENVDIEYEIKKAGKHKVSKWAGGSTTELYIYPKDRLYADRDFDWRISSADVELEESEFTKLGGYLRHIMVLSGKMKLTHEGHHTVRLEPFDHDFFNGSWTTKSVGKCVDFNLMLREGLSGDIASVAMNEVWILDPEDITCYYCLEDGITLEVMQNNENVMTHSLNKGDFIVFKDILDVKKQYVIRLYKEGLSSDELFLQRDKTVAVEAKIKKGNN